MSLTHIQESIKSIITYFSEHPEECRSPDQAVTAVVEEGLRCRAEGATSGFLITDMPKAIGGGGSAPSPGWYLRAALASCDATLLAMRAAQVGIALTTLRVTVESESDERGLLGMDETIAAGPLIMRTRIRIGADGVAPEHLREIASWAQAHSPVADAIRSVIPSETEVDVV